MTKVILRIRPLEPLHIGLRPVQGGETFGSDAVSPIPLPSTVIGLLGAHMGISEQCKPKCGDVWGTVDALICVAEQLEVRRVWGPVIRLADGWGMAIRVGATWRVVGLGGSGTGAEAEVKLDRQIHTALTGARVARPGYRWTSHLSSIIHGGGHAEFIYLVEADRLEPGIEWVARVGGEGRLAKIAIERAENYGELVRWAGGVEGKAIALSPILLPWQGGDYFDASKLGAEVLGVPDSRGGYRLVVEHLGLGFSEMCNERRPTVLALPPGTVVKLGSRRSHLGELDYLGYGSLAPWQPH